jgi:hypothetical protein
MKLVYPSSMFIEVSVTNQKSQRSCICKLEESILLSFYDISIGFWNCSHSVLFLFFDLFMHNVVAGSQILYVQTLHCTPFILLL